MLTLFKKPLQSPALSVQYNGYCYYTQVEYEVAFIATKETDEHLYGDLLYFENSYQTIYYKARHTWHTYYHGRKIYLKYNSYNINIILSVIDYQWLIIKMHLLVNNHIIMPDIYTHMKSIIVNIILKIHLSYNFDNNRKIKLIQII